MQESQGVVAVLVRAASAEVRKTPCDPTCDACVRMPYKVAVARSRAEDALCMIQEAGVVSIMRRLINENTWSAELLQDAVHMPSLQLVPFLLIKPFVCISKRATLTLHHILEQPLYTRIGGLLTKER